MQVNQKKKTPIYKNDNIVESLNTIGTDVFKATTGEIGKIATDALTSVFGGPTKTSGEMAPNQVIEFGSNQQEAAPQPAPRHEAQPRPNFQMLDAETKAQIEAIRQELKALAGALKNLHQEVQTAIEQNPVSPGIYHINFYEQLRSFLKVLRMQIEDSRSWLATSNTRKKKMGYWGMFKKHGTTFGLSNERSLATAAG